MVAAGAHAYTVHVLPLQAFLEEEADKPVKMVGNRTECAMLMLMRSWAVDYRSLRDENQDKIYRVRFNDEFLSVSLRMVQQMQLSCTCVVAGGAREYVRL